MADNAGSRQIRAWYDESTIRVYQAYSNAIADTALARGTFVSPPFSMTRMTWIKPSFLWMMYRAGWGLKDAGQKRILAIDITRQGFESALGQAVLSQHNLDSSDRSFDQWKTALAQSQVRVQWDPERNLDLAPMAERSIQIGLRGEAVQSYLNEWIVSITEISELAGRIHQLVISKQYPEAEALLPQERVYPLRPELASNISASS